MGRNELTYFDLFYIQETMEIQVKDHFTELWRNYFGKADLPITFYFTDKEENPCSIITKEERVIIKDLQRVQKGAIMTYDVRYVKCKGGIMYTGYTEDDNEENNEDNFFVWNLAAKLLGERNKENGNSTNGSNEDSEYPQAEAPPIEAPAKYLVFKRWDKLKEDNLPAVVIFFATPDVISGLFAWSNFDSPEPNMAISPGASGCGALLSFPYLQKDAKVPLAVIGMFDPIMRGMIDENHLTFSMPYNKFLSMIGKMDTFFSSLDHWDQIKSRINRKK